MTAHQAIDDEFEPAAAPARPLDIALEYIRRG